MTIPATTPLTDTTANTWLSAVVPVDRRAPDDVSGVAGERLRVIPGPGVAAVVGSVPRTDFDERPLQAHLEDPAWLESTVRTHHRVVGIVARRGPSLPLRFATLYRDDDRVAAMLGARRGEFLDALDRIAGCAEWGVKLYVAQAASDASPTPTDTADDRPGTAYLLRRQQHHRDREQNLRRAADDAQQIHSSLAAFAAESTLHPLQSAEASGRRAPMVLNGAYLVDDGHLAAFDTAVDAVVEDHPELRLELTGPWPPYSFSSVGTEPEQG
jgi:hypothetical protein